MGNQFKFPKDLTDAIQHRREIGEELTAEEIKDAAEDWPPEEPNKTLTSDQVAAQNHAKKEEQASQSANDSETHGHRQGTEGADSLAEYFPTIRLFDLDAKPIIRGISDGHTISEFAQNLGKELSPHNFFVHNGKCCRITFDQGLGVYKIADIEPQEFRSLAEKHCWVVAIRTIEKEGGRKEFFDVKRSLTIDNARAALASDNFLSLLRPLASLNTVRLPIRRKTGAIELLPKGYDPESHIFTVEREESFKTNWSLEQGVEYFRNLLSEFCFNSDDHERSISVTIAYILTLFCTHILCPDTIRPAFIFSADAEGAGKTLAAKLGIIPRLGYCPTGSAPKEEVEKKKLIFSTALIGSPLLFLDNVSGYLKSPALEALITSTVIRDRLLGESKNQDISNVMTVVITGNNLSISPDMQRRCLLVEFFLEQARAEDRIIKNPLDDAKILKIRSQILSACWALVRAWDGNGQPNPRITLQSFLGWSEIIGGILENAGFSSPCFTPVLKDSGDRDFADMQKLVETMNPGREFRFAELVDYAADYGLFENLIPQEEDEHAASKRSKLADLWKKFGGRMFPSGQRFVIKGDSQRTRRYLVVESLD